MPLVRSSKNFWISASWVAHEPMMALADETIEDPVEFAKLFGDCFGPLKKDRVGLDRVDHRARCDHFDTACQSLGTVVRVPRVLMPGSIFGHADPWRCDTAHLARQLPRLLASAIEVSGFLPVEEVHGFAVEHP